MSRLTSAATLLMEREPVRTAPGPTHPRRASVRHEPGESPAEAAGQTQPLASFVPTTLPVRLWAP